MSSRSVPDSSAEGAKKLWYLKQIKLFAGLSWKEMRHLQRITKMEAYAQGDMIYLPGVPGDSVYLLKKGKVKISRVNEDGREILLTILERGEIFGEVEALNEEPRETLVRAMENTLVCEMARKDFDFYVMAYPYVGGRIIKLMGVRLRTIETRIGDLVFKSAPARLATVLLSLAESVGECENHGIRLQARLTHQNLANLMGASRETVSSLISRFSQHGLIVQEHRHIVILDKNRLTQVK